MIPKSRLDKAIKGLEELVDRNNKQHVYKVSKSNITIQVNGSQLWATIFYVSISILLPAGFLAYYLLTDETNTIVTWLLLLEVLFVYDLWKMIRGNTVFTIDFVRKQFRVENINGVFKGWFKPNILSFEELSEVFLKEKKIGTTDWLQLTATDKRKNTIVLTDMSSNYPESVIARKMKFLLEVIIWTHRQNTFDAV